MKIQLNGSGFKNAGTLRLKWQRLVNITNKFPNRSIFLEVLRCEEHGDSERDLFDLTEQMTRIVKKIIHENPTEISELKIPDRSFLGSIGDLFLFVRNEFSDSCRKIHAGGIQYGGFKVETA